MCAGRCREGTEELWPEPRAVRPGIEPPKWTSPQAHSSRLPFHPSLPWVSELPGDPQLRQSKGHLPKVPQWWWGAITQNPKGRERASPGYCPGKISPVQTLEAGTSGEFWKIKTEQMIQTWSLTLLLLSLLTACSLPSLPCLFFLRQSLSM